ncbi:hypothetical protein BD413DRAFT_600202 [Trametes elegans]|nr:hypothetical protein BD413DRAFT_600202 [Trametes elegans]
MSATPPRRSSRLHSKPALSYAEHDEPLETSGSEPGPSTTARSQRRRPPKRPRRSAPDRLPGEQTHRSPKSLAPRGRRRTLSKLVDMPLDILFEIFGHLNPYDLLQLSRTTKALREILMHRSAITIWRNARLNVDELPDCPPDLAEPAYANLLFDNHCHYCVKARVMTVLWQCRTRACKSCLKEHFSPLFDVLIASSQSVLNYTLKIDVSAMAPMEYLNNKLLIPTDKARELITQIKECRHDHAALRRLEKERTDAVKRLKASAALLTEWQLNQHYKRTMDLIDLRLRRRGQIVERLFRLGYGDDLKWMTASRLEQFIEHPLVRQSKELTDRIWNNIKETMVAFAQEVRTERLMRERCMHYINRLCVVRDTVVRFLARRPLWESLPSVADFSWHSPGFRFLLNTPRDVFYKALYIPAAQLETVLMDEVRTWRATMAKKLYDLAIAATASASAPALPSTTSGNQSEGTSTSTGTTDSTSGSTTNVAAPSPPPEPTAEEIISRVCSARTWFRCTNAACGALLDYPRVLAHACAHAPRALDLHPASDAADLQNAYTLVLDETPWDFTGGRVAFDVHAQAAADAVVRACGRDPARTDAWEMGGRRWRLACSLCSRDGVTCVMAWARAVAHLAEHAREGREAKVTCLSRRDTRAVLRREPTRLVPYFSSVYRMYGCVRCRARGRGGAGTGTARTLADVLEHCADAHGVDMPTEGEDYDLHPDAETDRGVPAHDVYYDASLFLTPIRR